MDKKLKKNKPLSYWVEEQHKIYLQLLQCEHTPLTLKRKSALKNIWFIWMVEKGSAGKGLILNNKKIPDESKR